MNPGPAFAILALAVAVPGVQAQTWLDEFEVVNVEPVQRGVTAMYDPTPSLLRIQRLLADVLGPALDPDYVGVRSVPLKPATKQAIEAHLKESALLLREWGFPAPLLEPRVTTEDGRRAYRVYLLSEIDGASGRYLAHQSGGFAEACIDLPDEAIILLDATSILDAEGDLTTFGRATVGHELFHAVQWGTRFYDRRCRNGVGDWITEGTAKAMGWDLVRLLGGGPIPADYMQSRWGLRNYSDRLPVPLRRPDSIAGPLFSGDPAYMTSSFWRHLAEYDAVGAPPGPAPEPVDYRYLAQLLEMPRVEGDCRSEDASCDAEIQWLDEALPSLLGIDLRQAFATFMASYVVWGDLRTAPVSEGFMAEHGGLEWRSEAFDHGCFIIDLGPGLEEQSVSDVFAVEEMAAQCWDVRPEGFGSDVAVEVEVSAPSEALLSQFLGVVGGSEKVDTVHPDLVVADDRGARASWTYVLPDGEPSYYLLANVAKDAEDTRAMRGIQVTFTALASAVTYSGTVNGTYPISRESPPHLRITHGQDPYPDACLTTMMLRPDDVGDVLILGNWLPAPPRVGRYSVVDQQAHQERWSGTYPVPPPPVGTLSFQARLSAEHPGVDFSAGIPVQQSTGGVFEILHVDGNLLHGRFDVPTDGVRFEGYFVARLDPRPDDDPCRPTATPDRDEVVGDGPVG